ncbi:MAG: 50S ribosome-binding GTPase [Victivallaceae bacterium]|nr:50S ribosome-binding GTPase [Victivallaceae bacterium]
MTQFEFTQKNQRLSALRKELAVYKDDEVVGSSIRKMEEELQKKEADEQLKIAVCGQYSAGKSTLVKALTHDNAIAIGQDVTTDHVQCYEWEGMSIADTPGIYAGREEHDALSLDYIQKADLLIYMVTIQGFTREIGANFKKLVLGKYGDKTMLVMNKRNQEPAENESNWVKDTTDFLGDPDLMKKFYFSIVDIEDYLLGQNENLPELIVESHFNDFLEKLNIFTKERGLIGRVVSRINIVDAVLSMYIEDFSHSPEKDIFTTRQINAVQRAITEVNRVVSEESRMMRQEVKELKHRLVGLLTDETLNEFKPAYDNAQLELEKIMDPSRIADKIQGIIEELENDMQDIEQDALNYDARMSNFAQRYPNIDIGNAVDLSSFKTGLSGVSQALGGITKDGLKEFVHFFGGKFKPWGATKCMKCLKFVGPVVAIIGTVIDIVQFAKDEQHQRDLENARQEIFNSFNEIENGIETQMEEVKNAEGSIGTILCDLKNQLVEREHQQEKLKEHKQELLVAFKRVREKLNEIM